MSSSYHQPQTSYPRPSRTPSPNPSLQYVNAGVNGAGGAAAPRLPPKDNSRSVPSASRPGSNSGSPHNNNNNSGHSKDYLSLPPSTSSFSNNLSKYATAGSTSGPPSASSDADTLAQAVRDSVQIRSPSPSSAARHHQQQQSTYLIPPIDNTSSSSTKTAMARRSPSPQLQLPSVNFARGNQQPDFSMGPPVPGGAGGWEPGHGYSHSSPDMGHVMAPSPAMPRQANAPVNPFEEDEVEQYQQAPQVKSGGAKTQRSPEGAGLVAPSRQKFSRSASGTTPSSVSQTPLLATSPDTAPAPAPVPKSRVRRSLSTDSYGVDTGAMRELTAGQKKAAAEKKGSKHADIIDRWDPTGLGDAMWHHSGPYDAAAPSRNIGNTKAPMQVFSSSTPPATATAPTSSTAAQGRKTGTIHEDETSRTSAPVSSSAAPIPAASARQPINRRVSGGGLTGQYSTSIPTGGGYFPDAKQPQDEVSIARLEREREKEMKQRALKAAWGIDEPEPWEDFGVSPNESTGALGNEGLAHDTSYGKPLRSPGLRLGNNRADSFSKDGTALPSPPIDNSPMNNTAELPGAAAAGRPGVKRTKSLMQKFKTMVRTRSGSVASSTADGGMPMPSVIPGGSGGRYRDRDREHGTPGGRSQSMSTSLGSGGWGGSPARPGAGYEQDVMEEEEVVEDGNDGDRFRDAEEEEDVFGHHHQGSRGLREGVGRVVQPGSDRRRY